MSDFKAKLTAHLRAVQEGERLVITEHKRPVATVEPLGRESDLVDPAEKRFTLDLGPSVCTYPGLAAELLAAERQERYEE